MTDGGSFLELDKELILKYGVCGYKNPKRAGYTEKIEWYNRMTDDGLKIYAYISEKDVLQGMVEYLPGDKCWRPVNAKGYMFIHCLFMGLKKEYKEKGFASALLDKVEADARESGLAGVAVVTRKGSFMVGKAIFEKRGYKVVDEAQKDFELLTLSFDSDSECPSFSEAVKSESALDGFDKVTIIRAFQCPYTVKNVREIEEACRVEYGFTPTVITLESAEDAQACPNPFGTFALIIDGKLEAQHPISKGRFLNIMKKSYK